MMGGLLLWEKYIRQLIELNVKNNDLNKRVV
jgi:hypothetical protein